MVQWYRRRSACLSSLLLFLPLALPTAQGREGRLPALPLFFVEHPGAQAAEALFEARLPGARAVFTATGFLLETEAPWGTVRTGFRFEGARSDVRIRGVGELAGRVHRLVGPRDRWIRGARTWEGIRYDGLYEGIDLEVRVREGRLEYDLVVQPGADPKDVVVRCRRSGKDGVDEDETLRLRDDGSLVVGGAVVQRAPRSRQRDADGVARDVDSAFRLLDGGRFTFSVPEYDSRRVLVIDPVLVYTRYVGGSQADEAWGVAVDSEGAVYVAGWTKSSDFPLGEHPLDVTRDGKEAVVFKLDPTGTSLVWATFFGGKGDDRALDLAVNPAGEAYLTGDTRSDDFPVTTGAHTTARPGGADAFVLSLSADGAKVRFATYLGGASDDTGRGIALDAGNNVFLVGTTRSGDLPVTPHAFQTKRRGARDAFVVKLDASGSFLQYATYLGGLRDEEGNDIAVAPGGYAFVAGRTGSTDFPVTAGAFDETKGDVDAFVTNLSADGSVLRFSTFLGGSLQDEATAIAWVSDETVAVAGWTRSSDFPVAGDGARTEHAGRQDGFVTRFSVSGGALVYSTLLGGTGADECFAVGADATGTVWVAGRTDSDDFPVTGDAAQGLRGGGADGFAARIDEPGGSLGWASYFGRGGDEVLRALHVNSFTGEVAAAGDANHVPPLLRGDLGGRSTISDAFVARIAPGACGARAAVEVLGGSAGARLSATPPHLGGELTLTVSGASPEAEGVLVVGKRAEFTTPLEGKGEWFLSPDGSFPLCTFRTDAEGTFTLRLPLPPAAGLCGHQSLVQGFVVAPHDGPLVFGQVTDAVHFTLGD